MSVLWTSLSSEKPQNDTMLFEWINLLSALKGEIPRQYLSMLPVSLFYSDVACNLDNQMYLINLDCQ